MATGEFEHDLQHAPLAVLDALGDLDLALAGEQRHRPHLAQVHAHGIVGLGVAVVLFLLLDLDRPRRHLGASPSSSASASTAGVFSSTFTWVDASTISMPSPPKVDSQSSIWSDETMFSGMWSLTSS